MPTTYQQIYEQAQTSFQDWEMDIVYANSVVNYEAIMQSYLIKAISNFEHCVTNLADRDSALKIFNATLSDLEITILSNLLVLEWLEHNIQDLNQMQLHIRDSEFNTSSEGANLKAKLDLRTHLREQANQLKTQYSLNRVVDWEGWKNGVF